MRRVALPALCLVLWCGLAGVGRPANEACAAEERPPVKIPPGLRERLLAAEGAVKSEPRDRFPSFRGFRAATDFVDVSTTGTAARLTELLVTAEKVRAALGWWLGPGKWARLSILERPIVFCRDTERRAWLKGLGLSPKDLEWHLARVWNQHAGLFVVASEPAEPSDDPATARRVRGIVAAALTFEFIRTVYPKWPPFLREGFRFVVTAALNGTTTIHVTKQSDYDSGGRAYNAAALRDMSTADLGPIYNPHYVTGLITRKKDDDLRLALGKSYDTLTADDDAKAFFFVRWLLEEVDPKGAEAPAWFQALATPEEDVDAATKKLCPDVKVERVLEVLDTRFREYHVRANPLPAWLQRDWTGTWAPTRESLEEWNKEAKRKAKPEIRSLRLELGADGTWVETVDLDPGKDSETRGTWELDEAGIKLTGKRFTGAARSDLKFFRTRSLQEGDLVWQKKKGGD